MITDAARPFDLPGPPLFAAEVLALAAVLAVPAGESLAQAATDEASPGRVLHARVHAVVPESRDGGAMTEVSVRYRLAIDTRVREIPLRGLAFFGAAPRDVRATIGGESGPLDLDDRREPLLTGQVDLPASRGSGDTLELELSYRLTAAIPAAGQSFDLVLPVLYVDWPPAGAPADMLQARIVLPADYSIQESFPTVPREISTRGGQRRYDLDLQTVPSMIRFRGHAGDPPLLTFSRLVDLGVVAILALAAALGWAALRRERARASREAGAG